MGNLILILGICLIFNGIVANMFDDIAKMKGHSGYWSWCFWLGLAGWLMVVALPDRNTTTKNNQTTGKSGSSDDEVLPDL